MEKIKACKNCGTMFGRKKKYSDKQWESSMFCSHRCWANDFKRPLWDRLYEQFIPKPNTGCWLWVGAGCEKGYGFIKSDFGTNRAHRVSWILHKGPIPDGKILCHTCDTPACINPDHLYIGTHQDNAEDKRQRDRQRYLRGADTSWAKLTEADVVAIRKDSRPATVIARQLGVSDSTVRACRNGQNWVWLEGTGTPAKTRRP